MQRSRTVTWSTVIALAVMLFGAGAGALFGERSIPPEEAQLVLEASELVTTLVEWLPEEHDPEDVVYDGIAGMLEVLDPHSNYLDPRSFRKMRSRQEGSFFGVGIIISERNGKVTVIAPIAGTPAAARGLRAGDVIAAVEGQSTEELSLDDVVDQVRGPEGTEVEMTIARPGLKGTFDVSITRARIPQNSVRYAFMIEPGIGYIRLSEFSNTSVREVRDAIASLEAQGMEQLVFDLRNNPGGPLDAAVGVSDLFLREGQLIVSTRGRTRENNAAYHAPGRGNGFEGPLVIMVNGGSASASEIVAGAVQDHDRGVVLGETTWGKGLVQTVFTVRDTGLALTTARYYTPSGRCIQRDYESFIDYITHRNGTSEDAPRGEIYETDAGRTVLGGGGITPDVTVEARALSDEVARLYGQSAFFRFAVSLLSGLPDDAKLEYANGFAVDEEILDRFWRWVREQELLIGADVEKASEDAQDVDDVSLAIHTEVLNATAGLDAGYRHAIAADDQFVAAKAHLEDAADIWEAWQSED